MSKNLSSHFYVAVDTEVENLSWFQVLTLKGRSLVVINNLQFDDHADLCIKVSSCVPSRGIAKHKSKGNSKE